jgi:CelD/BcsL family acetyltransferase involved in cellulose biosynthesis
MNTRTSNIVTSEDCLAAAEGLEPGWLYHERHWRDVLIDGFGVESAGIVTRDELGNVLAATPIWIRRRYGIKMVGSPMRGLFTEFAGPRFSRAASEEVRAAVLAEQHKLLRSLCFGYVEWGVRGLTTSESTSYFADVMNCGVEYMPRPTLTVNLADGCDAVWSRFEGRARNMIRKAEKVNVSAGVESMQGGAFERFIDLVEETFRRQGKPPPHPRKAYIAMARHLCAVNAIRFIAARLEDRLVAGGLFLVWRDRMVYLSGAASEEGYRVAASSLIQWSAVRMAVEAGVKSYDLGGVGVESIDKFKASFGGVPNVHHRYVWVAPSLRLAFKAAEILARTGILKLNR